jgi:predicted TIM-barrel fold metal-dependent hydrolase
MIDFHTHIGRLNSSLKPLSAKTLISIMDHHQIKQAVVLPVENPEELHYYSTTDYVIQECMKYPTRLIPFCCIDPRRGVPKQYSKNVPKLVLDPRQMIEGYIHDGCKGFGECLQGLPIDDPRASRLYQVCGEFELPVVLHIMHAFINYDQVGLPGFERILKLHSDTIFIAHANGWWSEISGSVDPSIAYSYPTGKITRGGRAIELLSKYDNLYADLSAGSGYNALTRDPEFGLRFLEQYADRLLFGTDILAANQELPIINFIKTAPISRKAYQAITETNAKKLLRGS